MRQPAATCPLTTAEIIGTYFIENRTRLLDIAAFLDRVDRSRDSADASREFRIEAFQRALSVLTGHGSDRVQQIQMILSDPTTEPLEALDQKSASGAWNPRREAL